MDRILDYIECGKAEGARLVCGGERDTEGDKAQGFFVKPTIFADVTPDMQNRPRGDLRPGALRHPFRDADEAIRIANGTIYGLAAAVWTRDLRLAHRMAGEIKAGSCLGQHLQRVRFRIAVRRLQAERLRPRPGQPRRSSSTPT